MQKGRILAVDYGLKRVGVAITDPERLVVFPRETLKNNEYLVPDLLKICADERVLTVVIGVPLKIDGTETGQSKISRDFAEKLAKDSGLDVQFQDEAYTTFEAEQMIEKKEHIYKDSFSAMKILEHYLKKIKK